MKLVLIEWLDSHGVSAGWQRLDNYESTLPVMKSVGWIVYENDKLVSVCGNMAEETDSTAFQGNGIMTIPKCAILSTVELTTPLKV